MERSGDRLRIRTEEFLQTARLARFEFGPVPRSLHSKCFRAPAQRGQSLFPSGPRRVCQTPLEVARMETRGRGSGELLSYSKVPATLSRPDGSPDSCKHRR